MTEEELVDGEKQKINEFHNKFFKLKDFSKKTKLEFANFLKELIDGTFKDYKSIEETCIKITGFFQYDFNDNLDEILSLAADLELPKEHVDGDVFKKWELLKNKLDKYLEK